MLNFFISDKISVAKDILWLFCGTHVGDKVCRRPTTSRSQQDADVSDIICAFKKLEEFNVDIPMFVTVNLDRMPHFSPEETNIFSLIDKVLSHERALATANEDIEGAKNDIVALKSVQLPIVAPSNVLPYAAVVTLPPPTPSANCSPCTPSTSTTYNRPTASAIQSSNVNRPTTTIGMSQSSSTNKTMIVTDDDGFQTAPNHRRNRRNRKPVVGTKKNELFHGLACLRLICSYLAYLNYIPSTRFVI